MLGARGFSPKVVWAYIPTMASSAGVLGPFSWKRA